MHEDLTFRRFSPTMWPGGGYLKVDKSVGSLIDWYNVQFYNQGSSEYTTCNGLLTASSSTWPESALFQIAANGVSLSKLVIGKPATSSDASNGYMSTSTLASCVATAKSQGWNGGVMVWEHKQRSKKPLPWVHVNENDNQLRKTPLKVLPNGTQSHRHSYHAQRQKIQHTSSNGQSAQGLNKSTSDATLQEQRKQLPIAKGRDTLIQEIQNNDVTVLLGETGSGKTTQIPQYILESGIAGKGMIAVTQPRRVAATSLASRVAKEKNSRIGDLVGYSVRFDECSSENTRIKYMTDGMIVRELLSDPMLSQYSVVVVDEAHERTLRTDLLIANLKTIQKKRNGEGSLKGKENANNANPLKIVIMSATLDAEKFSQFFDGAKILYVKGRQHPVKIYHSSEGQTDYVESAMRTFFQIHTDQPPGDVLIFLPGQEDIEGLQKSIRLFANQLPTSAKEVLICAMYASQASGQNDEAFSPTPANTRKCILATNIAETSITIPGVKYVIDTGMCKEKRYLARDTGGEESFTKMELAPEPEILRCSLTSSILQLKCLGQDLENLDLMDTPEDQTTLKTLWMLDAINTKMELTPLGRKMALFPLEPVHARFVLAAAENGCTSEILEIISVLSASSKLFVDITEQREVAAEARSKFRHSSGDHLTILNTVRTYESIVGKTSKQEWCRKNFINERTLREAGDIKKQLRQTCERVKINWKVTCGDNDEPVIQSLAHGLAQNCALLQPDGSYKHAMGQSIVKIHPSSVLCDKKVPAILFDELVFTNQVFARGVSSVPMTVLANIGALSRRIGTTS
ncbi:hypothetical protein H0H93_010154 [Arthromyces matolae]|nr:hypothetical protein H0H93_010154 [Arthromyces matolae]